MIIAGHNLSVLLVDTEFSQHEGEKPTPLCLVMKELQTGITHRIWLKGGEETPPPILSRPDTLLVAYLASAEIACLMQLEWPLPEYVLDLYPEFRNLTNGRRLPDGAGLAAAVKYFGGNEIDIIHKAAMRELSVRGTDYTPEEQRQLLDYCESDVIALEQVFQGILPHINTEFPLIRGRYMRGIAAVEISGIPIDTEAFAVLQTLWPKLRVELTNEIGNQYPGVFINGSFSTKGFDNYLSANAIRWPRTESGKPKVDQDTFKEWAPVYPQLKPMKELLALTGQLKLHRLAVGSDGRNRYLTGAFGSITSRNQPSANRNIFGLPSFLRGLIRPEPGQSLAYLDYEQQEFGIAAALSGDTAMQLAYSSGDPYLSFAKQAGAAPPNATKESHREIREAFKTTALGVQYGMGAQTLALRLGRTEADARDLLALHRRTYKRFWQWGRQTADLAIQERRISTRFGWQLHVTRKTKEQTLANFPMQANGADMLRLALCLAQDAGIRVVAMVHDALLIEAADEEIDTAVQKAKEAMTRASEVILGGFVLRTEACVIRHPDRFLPSSGVAMWNRVWQIAAQINGEIPSGILRTKGE